MLASIAKQPLFIATLEILPTGFKDSLTCASSRSVNAKPQMVALCLRVLAYQLVYVAADFHFAVHDDADTIANSFYLG